MAPSDDPIETAPPGQPGSVPLTAVPLLLTGALLAAVSCTRGPFNTIFLELSTKMPAITDVVRSPRFVWIVAVLFGLTIVSTCVLRNSASQRAWNKIAILAALVLGGLYVSGMFLPLVRLANLRN